MSVNYIHLDIDEDFDKFADRGLPRLLSDISMIPYLTKTYIRSSSGNRVHVRIETDHDLGLMGSFSVRAHLGDDPMRIYHDLKRYHRAKYGTVIQVDRLFDRKFVRGKLRAAGRWIEL
jgi:hypothetical protein